MRTSSFELDSAASNIDSLQSDSLQGESLRVESLYRDGQLETPFAQQSLADFIPTQHSSVRPECSTYFDTAPWQERLQLSECVSVREQTDFVVARNSLPRDFLAFVTPFSVQEYIETSTRLFLTSDKRSGFGICGTEVVSVFDLSTEPRGVDLVDAALALGADYLSCFDGKVRAFYEKCGFIEVSRTPWNEEYAPALWNYERFGQPDYIIMKFALAKELTYSNDLFGKTSFSGIEFSSDE